MSDTTGYGGYGQMPPGQPGGPVERGPAPAPVLTAVKLMFARAGLGVLSLLAVFATKSSLKTQIEKANTGFDASKIDSLVTASLAIAVVFGLIFIVLYVLLALQVRKGKNWARIVTFVLAGLGILSALAGLTQPEPLLTRLVGLVAAILDIGVIYLLAQRASSAYFRGPR